MKCLMIFIWIPMLAFLYPLPPEQVRQMVGGEVMVELNDNVGIENTIQKDVLAKVERKFWEIWGGKVVALLLGLMVGVMAVRQWKYWKEFAIGFSFICIGLALLQYFFSAMEINPSFLFFYTDAEWIRLVQFNVRMVIVGVENGEWWISAFVFYKEFVLPLFELMVFVWVVRCYLGERAANRKSSL